MITVRLLSFRKITERLLSAKMKLQRDKITERKCVKTHLNHMNIDATVSFSTFIT